MSCTEITLIEESFQKMKVENYDGELDDGKYRARVDDVRFIRSKNGYQQLVWDLEILTPPHMGTFLTRRNTLTKTRETLMRLDADLKMCGVDLMKIADLAKRDTLIPLLGCELLVKVVNTESGKNVYFIKPLRRGESCRSDLDE